MQKQVSQKVAAVYAWVVLGVLFMGGMVTFGMRASFSAYISPWELDFSTSRTVITTVSVISFAVLAFAQPFMGRLNDYFGKSFVPSVSIFLLGICLYLTSRATQVWQVFILFGVGFSLGSTGCSNVIGMVSISNWFVKKRGFALGLVTSGQAVGQLILVPLNLFLIREYGWRSTMAALSIIIVIVVAPLFIFLLRSKPEEKGLKPYGYMEAWDDVKIEDKEKAAEKISLSVIGVLKQRNFWLLTIPYFICGFTDVGLVQTHLIPMSEGKGFPLEVVAIASSLIAALNIAGTIVTGYLSDKFSRKRQLGIIYITRAATFFILIFIRQPWLLLPFAVVYGAIEMASIAPTNTMIVQLFERYSKGAVIGLIAVSHQLGGAAGSWVPGLLYDLTGSYVIILAVSVALLLGAGLLVQKIPEPGRVEN